MEMEPIFKPTGEPTPLEHNKHDLALWPLRGALTSWILSHKELASKEVHSGYTYEELERGLIGRDGSDTEQAALEARKILEQIQKDELTIGNYFRRTLGLEESSYKTLKYKGS